MEIRRNTISGSDHRIETSKIQATISPTRVRKKSKLIGLLDEYTDRTDLSYLLTAEGRHADAETNPQICGH